MHNVEVTCKFEADWKALSKKKILVENVKLKSVIENAET